MHFKTLSHWEDKNPFLKVFDDPENPGFRWRAVELPLAVYYYHVHYVPNSIDIDSVCTDILLGDIDDVLAILLEYPGTTLSLQVPAWANNDEPGLYRVVAIYKSADPATQTHIAECSDGKLHAVGILAMDMENLNLATVEKVTLWTSKVKRKN